VGAQSKASRVWKNSSNTGIANSNPTSSMYVCMKQKHKIGMVYSDIPKISKVFFTPHHVSHSCTMSSEVILE
jgi:hypothetical protein